MVESEGPWVVLCLQRCLADTSSCGLNELGAGSWRQVLEGSEQGGIPPPPP